MLKETFSQSASDVLLPYKERFEKELAKAFEQFSPQNGVKEAMVYALSGSGKRFRPALVYMVADALGRGIDVTPSALAVEYFHTSSLLADDLPCMDNDDFRRGRLTTHKVYGEAIALLASYGLIAAGFENIALNGNVLPSPQGSEVAKVAILEASKQMGNPGLIGGQFFDLYPKNFGQEHLIEITKMKTVALFDLSMSLGWLFGGGDIKKLDAIHSAAFHFGVAFQLLDDIDDMPKDAASGRMSNFANQFGQEVAIELIREHVTQFHRLMHELKLSHCPLSHLAQGLL